MTDYRDRHIEVVRRAVQDKGPHPEWHDRQIARLRNEWPTLYNAIANLIALPPGEDPA